uniref:Zinc-ribbon domain-containing protein n=1 Tax=Oryza punctata TaxID=4537 RepID=A0A0E0LFY0_ORYPU
MPLKPYPSAAFTNHDDDSNSSDCVLGSYGSSLSLRGATLDDDDQSALENTSRPSSPFHVLKPQDVLPIEAARTRILDIVVDHFIAENVIEVPETSGLNTNDRVNKRKKQDIRYEGDPMFALPLMYIANLYETLVTEIDARLASLTGFRHKTIGLSLEAAGGLYRKLTQKFPKKGTCSFRRRELATSHSSKTKFPELVVHEEKRVRFVVINGLVIIERPKNMTAEDAEWFIRLTGRSEVAISSRDYKFYSPRHKYRRITQPALAEDDNSPLVCSSGFRPPNEPTSPAKFCDECGSPYLRATSKFCSECGTKRLGM